MRIYLKVNNGDASKVEDLGAKWDDGFNRWYINAWSLPKAFMEFAPQNYDQLMDARFSAHQLTPYEIQFLKDHPSEYLDAYDFEWDEVDFTKQEDI